MTKEEILKLHELSEGEQYLFLDEHDLRKTIGFQAESLADCAFRLRDEMQPTFTERTKIAMNANPGKTWSHFRVNSTWWHHHAKPIHWIQSALLARLEK